MEREVAMRTVLIGTTIIAVTAAIIGFYSLSKKGPRGAVLIADTLVFFCGMSIPDNSSRELHLLEGILRLSGFIGVMLGVTGLIRKKPAPTHRDKFGE